jgi:flagellar M-ring protein FliF
MVVLAFGVRPALHLARPQRKDSSRGGAKELPIGTAGAAQPALKPPEPAELDPERQRTQEIFEQVTAHLKREPSQSSRLLQSWIHSD